MFKVYEGLHQTNAYKIEVTREESNLNASLAAPNKFLMDNHNVGLNQIRIKWKRMQCQVNSIHNTNSL